MNWTDFWHMGGYAGYVWPSFGVTALFLVAELVLLRKRRKATLARLRRIRNIENA